MNQGQIDKSTKTFFSREKLIGLTHQGRRKRVGKVGSCPPSFWRNESIENFVIAISVIPIYCLPTQIINTSYAHGPLLKIMFESAAACQCQLMRLKHDHQKRASHKY